MITCIPISVLDPVKESRGQPEVETDIRQAALIGLFSEEFVYRCRHMFCSRYSDMTFQILAYTIICLTPLNIEVDDIFESCSSTGRIVWLANPPDRPPMLSNHIHFSRATVICRRFADVMPRILDDSGKKRTESSKMDLKSKCSGRTYTVLSI